jgi:hypothetical protein
MVDPENRETMKKFTVTAMASKAVGTARNS